MIYINKAQLEALAQEAGDGRRITVSNIARPDAPGYTLKAVAFSVSSGAGHKKGIIDEHGEVVVVE